MRHPFSLILCWAVYTLASFGRVNLPAAIPYLQDSCGYSKAALGIVAAGFFGSYAIGQLINGVLGDRFKPRYFAGIGLFAAGLANTLFGLTGNLAAMVLLWSLNGYFQSMLWGPMVRLVSESAPPKKLHRGILALSSSTMAGYLLAYGGAGGLALRLGWRTAFIVPGVLLILASAFWFRLLRGAAPSPAVKPAPPGGPEGVLGFVIRTRLWVVALVCVLNGLIKEGLGLWGPAIFAESHPLGMEGALSVIWLLPLLNLPVLALNGWVNRLFRYHEKYSLLVFLVLSVLCALWLQRFMGGNLVLMSVGFFGLFGGVFGVNNTLTAVIPANFHREGRISTAAGFLDSAIYLGAAVSGPLTGMLADRAGWKAVSGGWIAAGIAAAVLSLFTRDYKKGVRRPSASD